MSNLWPVRCAHCNALNFKSVSEINRAEKRNSPLYCNRECSGQARRLHRSDTEKKQYKADYDRQRREKIGKIIRAQKRAAYHAAVAADPDAVRAKEKAHRDKRMPHHVEYCRRPEYRKWKAAYDQKHRAYKQFGPFGEAAIILNQLDVEIRSRATWTEIARDKGTLNKTQERKRDYARKTGQSVGR